MEKRKNRILNNQKGFTLIEIIAVLVIMGILAAVAVPKYMDLQTEAKNKAVDAGISELNGRLSLAFAKNILVTGTAGGYDSLDLTLKPTTDWTTTGVGGDTESENDTPKTGDITFKGEIVGLTYVAPDSADEGEAFNNASPGYFKRT